MSRVNREESEFPIADSAHDRFGFGRMLLSVSDMGPHNQNVCLVERLVGETLLRVIKGRCLD